MEVALRRLLFFLDMQGAFTLIHLVVAGGDRSLKSREEFPPSAHLSPLPRCLSVCRL